MRIRNLISISVALVLALTSIWLCGNNVFFVRATTTSPSLVAQTPTRRALLIPISQYGSVPKRNDMATSRQSRRAGNIRARGGSLTPVSNALRTVETLCSLEGPPNDVAQLAALLVSRYRFERQNVHVLPEVEATHDGILQAIQKYLIDEAAPDDECLLYYSGHGSWIRNSKGEQTNKQQETLVPLDYVRPITRREEVRDILDWELRALFNRALDKGVTLTFIADSCHSGSIARGEQSCTTRAAQGSTFDLAEAPPASADPRERGLLTLAASLSEQQAREDYFEEKRFGVFTYALLKVLSSQSAEAMTAQELFELVEARVRADRKVPQDPVIQANKQRSQLNLFGAPVIPRAERRLFTVVDVDKVKKTAKLDIGRAVGLTAGSILVKQGDTAKEEDKLRLRVIAVPSMTESYAVPVTSAHFLKLYKKDVFELESWAAAPESVSVWLPPASLSLAELQKLKQSLAPLWQSSDITRVSDPTEEHVTHTLAYNGKTWNLRMPNGKVELLSNPLTADAIKKKLEGQKAALFISVPLSQESRARIELGAGTPNSAVKVVTNEAAAHYKLVGRFGENDAVEYAWMLAGAEKDEIGSDNQSHSKESAQARPAPMPPITNWVAAAGQVASCDLVCLAFRLNRIYGWIHLQSPPEAAGGQGTFPYRLGIFDQQGNEISPIESSKLIEGSSYVVKLVPRPNVTKPVSRWVYVYTLDKNGAVNLFYPNDPGIRNSFPAENQDKLPDGSVILSHDLKIVGPPRGVLGAEIYVLLALNEKIATPEALNADAVKPSPSGVRGADVSPLEMLLSGISAGTRSSANATPTSWWVQHVFLESRPK